MPEKQGRCRISISLPIPPPNLQVLGLYVKGDSLSTCSRGHTVRMLCKQCSAPQPRKVCTCSVQTRVFQIFAICSWWYPQMRNPQIHIHVHPDSIHMEEQTCVCHMGYTCEHACAHKLCNTSFLCPGREAMPGALPDHSKTGWKLMGHCCVLWRDS